MSSWLDPREGLSLTCVQTSQVVRRVGHRLVKASGLMDEHQWEFHVINDDKIMNAMAMPGGKVGNKREKWSII